MFIFTKLAFPSEGGSKIQIFIQQISAVPQFFSKFDRVLGGIFGTRKQAFTREQ